MKGLGSRQKVRDKVIQIRFQLLNFKWWITWQTLGIFGHHFCGLIVLYNMNVSKIALTLILFLNFFISKSQTNNIPRNEIGLMPFRLDVNAETLHNRVEPKFLNAFYFKRDFGSWSWISFIEYGENIIDDDCKNCADHYYGKGVMTEFGLGTGIRYTFLKNNTTKIKPFIEMAIYYKYIKYEGHFGGGFTGSGTYLNNNHHNFGLGAKFGLEYSVTDRFSISLSSLLSLGPGLHHDLVQETKNNYLTGAYTPLQLSVGYKF